jgi:hypothetical protein
MIFAVNQKLICDFVKVLFVLCQFDRFIKVFSLNNVEFAQIQSFAVPNQGLSGKKLVKANELIDI